MTQAYGDQASTDVMPSDRSGLAPELRRNRIEDDDAWMPPPGIELPQPEGVNVGDSERAVSVAAGAILAMLGIARRGIPGLIIGALGGGLLYRGITGHCPVYSAMDVEAPPEENRGIHVEQAFIINRSPEDLYAYWRNFENLPQIMTHLESVRVIDDRRSHWVARAPRIAGGQVEWDAEIIAEEPNRLIAWRSLPDSQVDNAGAIRFAPAMGDRGTEVHVFMNYLPPGGMVGNLLAKFFGENPKRIIREDLRNFKRLMETGDILTVQGQPRGTCTGEGTREQESDSRPLFSSKGN